jgi:hypothetical protein
VVTLILGAVAGMLAVVAVAPIFLPDADELKARGRH